MQTFDFLGITFSIIDMEGILRTLTNRPTPEKFQYIITPNVYHVVMINEKNNQINKYFEHAEFVVNDSKILQFFSFFFKRNGLPIVRGSDLTIAILRECLKKNDEITIVGCDNTTIDRLKSKFDLPTVHHINPSMGFDSKPDEIQQIVDFVVARPSRFIFFSVGAPRQEMLCARIFREPEAVGVAICAGAAIEFAAGVKARAPLWMRTVGLEWFFRLLQEPQRLGKRYLIDYLAIFPILWHEALSKRRVRSGM